MGWTKSPNESLLGKQNMPRLYGDKRSFDGYGLDVDILVKEVDSLHNPQLRALGSGREDVSLSSANTKDKLRTQQEDGGT